MSNSNKKKTKEAGQRMFAQWGIPIVALVIVLFALVSKFGVESESNALGAVNRRVSTETEGYARDIRAKLIEVSSVGQGAAAIIGQETDVDSSKWGAFADGICSHASNIYLAAIVDNTGKGVASGEKVVDLSKISYYDNTNTVKYLYVRDDEIVGKEAYVVLIPVKQGDSKIATMLLYVDVANVNDVLPTTEYGGRPSYAIITCDGSIVNATGSDSYFTNGLNLFQNLSTSTMSGLTLSQVKVRASKMTSMVFSATKGEERKTISVAPIGIEEAQLVCVISQSYVDTMIHSEMDSTRSLLISLAITLGIFLILLIVISFINKLKYKEESKDLADKADTDLLTAVNNKMATERKIQEYMDENPDSQCLMFMFDIDNFKKINDTMGHAFGDEVLSTLGHQLRNEFRVTDIIGRLGGDEFVLFLKNIKSDEQLEREGVRITNFFHQFKAGSYVQYSATASIGGAVFPRDAKNFHDLYQCADKALYEAKRRGKNQLVFYSHDIADVKSVRVTDDIDGQR